MGGKERQLGAKRIYFWLLQAPVVATGNFRGFSNKKMGKQCAQLTSSETSGMDFFLGLKDPSDMSIPFMNGFSVSALEKEKKKKCLASV